MTPGEDRTTLAIASTTTAHPYPTKVTSCRESVPSVSRSPIPAHMQPVAVYGCTRRVPLFNPIRSESHFDGEGRDNVDVVMKGQWRIFGYDGGRVKW